MNSLLRKEDWELLPVGLRLSGLLDSGDGLARGHNLLADDGYPFIGIFPDDLPKMLIRPTIVFQTLCGKQGNRGKFLLDYYVSVLVLSGRLNSKRDARYGKYPS